MLPDMTDEEKERKAQQEKNKGNEVLTVLIDS